MNLTIVNTTPSTIKVEVDEKKLSIGGEGLLPGFGSPDYIIFSKSILHWDTPFNDELIDHQAAAEIVDEVARQLIARGWKVEIE